MTKTADVLLVGFLLSMAFTVYLMLSAMPPAVAPGDGVTTVVVLFPTATVTPLPSWTPVPTARPALPPTVTPYPYYIPALATPGSLYRTLPPTPSPAPSPTPYPWCDVAAPGTLCMARGA